MHNHVTLVGYLGRDPEIRHTPGGTVVANFSLATSRGWKDKTSGERKEETEWHRCVAYDRLAEVIGEYLKKGSLALVTGRIKYSKYTDKDNIERYSTDIVVEEMRMLPSNPEGRNEKPEAATTSA